MHEPSAVLAGDELDGLFRVIHQLADGGVAVIYVSHRLDEVFVHCDLFTVLKDGQVAGSGRVRDVGRANLVRMMVGRELADTFPSRSGTPGRVRLEVTGLSVPGKLEAVSLQAREGEILGIAGLMGSGRTTLAKAVFGAVAATAGSVAEDGRREGLAVTKTVRWNASLLALGRLLGGVARLIRPAAERDLVRRLVSRLSIRTAPSGEDLVGRLSGGNQQKVVLGKWLEAGPKVLILDEPTRGIDVGTKEEIYQLLRDLAEQGLAVVVISSELIEVLGLADRILVLAEGRVAGELSGQRATEEAVMRLATGSAGPR